jgi:hypothetical protein
MKMVAIIAQTYLGDAILPAVTHRFLAPTYREARNLFRLHRTHDAMLRATTGQKDNNGNDRVGTFDGIRARTIFKVQRLDSSSIPEGIQRAAKPSTVKE